jgi:hypothetical protein
MHVNSMDHLKWVEDDDDSSFSTVKNNYDEKRYKGCLAISIYSRTCVSQRTVDPKCHRLSFICIDYRNEGRWWRRRRKKAIHSLCHFSSYNKRKKNQHHKSKYTNTLGACSTVSLMRMREKKWNVNRREKELAVKYHLTSIISWTDDECTYIYNRANILHLVAFFSTYIWSNNNSL